MRAATGVVTVAYVALLCALLAACAQQETATAPAPTASSSEEIVPTATAIIIPTLYPSETPPSSPAATASTTPAPTPSPQSTVDFEQPVIEMRYQIPALALDRRLEASVGGRVTVVDETLGVAAIRENQGAVLLELQEALPQLELPSLPADCETCVEFSYELPLDEESRQGWLTDTVMLASVENYTSVLLGPHFPPGTTVGLRRSATPYDVAHSLALTDEGLLWRWLATDPDVAQPVPVSEVDPALTTALDEVPTEDLSEAYRVTCMGAPVETLYFSDDRANEADEADEADEAGEADESEAQNTITITCPAFSLPSTLLPLYLRLDALMEPLLVEQSMPRPPLEIPLNTMVDYQRQDGARLTVTIDGQVRAVDPQDVVITDTLEATQVISFTSGLLETEAFNPGTEAYASGEAGNVLLARGPQGMAELAWDDSSPPAAMAEHVAQLDDLLDELLGDGDPAQEAETTLTATPPATPSGTPMATPEP